MRRTHLLIGACVLLAVLGILFFALSVSCHIPGKEFSCNKEQVMDLLQREGVASTLAFVDRVVLPRIGFAHMHWILHSVGEYAYATSGNVEEALRFLRPYETYAETGYFLSGFDGYVHGVLSSYFLQAGTPATFPDLMSEICESDMTIPGVTDEVFTCYHALGHALVHASANRIDPALAACKTAPSEEARNGCYYGLFMENMYLYFPIYHPDAPRPDAVGDSMTELCDRLEGEEKPFCFHFVGQSYLATHTNDLEGAFTECATLGVYGDTCALRLGHVAVTRRVGSEEEAVAFCTRYAETLFGSCMEGARYGIEFGFTPQELR